MAKHEIRFHLRNDLSELETLRQKLDQFKLTAKIPDKTILEVNLILDELFCNVVSCGFQDVKEHWVEIVVSRDETMLTLTVQDDGIPFNPSAAAPIDPDCSVEERRIGGIGLHLVQHLADEITYRHANACNIVTLKKKLP